MDRYKLLADNSVIDAEALDEGLEAIANAIRERFGLEKLLKFPQDFVDAITEAIDYPIYISATNPPGDYGHFVEIRGKAYYFDSEASGQKNSYSVIDIIGIGNSNGELALYKTDTQLVIGYDCVIIPDGYQLMKSVASSEDVSAFALMPGTYYPNSGGGAIDNALTWTGLENVISSFSESGGGGDSYNKSIVDSFYIKYIDDGYAQNYYGYFKIKRYDWGFEGSEYTLVLQQTDEIPIACYDGPDLYKRVDSFTIEETCYVQPALKYYFNTYFTFVPKQ